MVAEIYGKAHPRPDLVPETLALAREHGRQAELLADAGVDLILIETMNTQREAEAAAAAAARTGRPCSSSRAAAIGTRTTMSSQ